MRSLRDELASAEGSHTRQARQYAIERAEWESTSGSLNDQLHRLTSQLREQEAASVRHIVYSYQCPPPLSLCVTSVSPTAQVRAHGTAERLQLEVDSLSRQINAAKAVEREQKDEFNRQVDECRRLHQENVDLKTGSAEAQRAHEAVSAALGETEQRLSAAKAMVLDLQEERQRNQDELEQLRTALMGEMDMSAQGQLTREDLENQLSSAQRRLSVSEESLRAAHREIDRLRLETSTKVAEDAAQKEKAVLAKEFEVCFSLPS